MRDKIEKSKFISVFVPIMPIISAYSYSFTLIDLSTTILAFVLLFEIISRRIISINKVMGILVLYCSILSIILSLSGQLGMNTALGQVIRYVIIGFSIGTLRKRIDIELLYKAMKIVGIIVVIGMFYHAVIVYILHAPVSPIEILPVVNYDNWSINAMRPMSFFTEPQAFATYCIPLLIISLNRREYFLSGIITIAILLSSSSLGVAAAAIVFVLYIFANKDLKISIRVVLIVIAVLGVMAYSSIGIFQVSIGKLTSIGSTYSDYERLYKAFDTFGGLPIISKIFGVGHGTISSYATNHGLSLWWLTQRANDYLTTGFGIFVEYGIVGGLLLYMHYYRCFKRSHKMWTARMFLIAILVQTFTTTFFFNYGFLYFFLLFEALMYSVESSEESSEFVNLLFGRHRHIGYRKR